MKLSNATEKSGFFYGDAPLHTREPCSECLIRWANSQVQT
jgi:hypothetical protein